MNERKNRYIDFLAQLGVDHAHPGGRSLSEAIIRTLPIQAVDDVLDIGCGTGATAQYLADQTKASVTGIDLHPQMVKAAKKRSEQSLNPFRVVHGSAESLPFRDRAFDWLFSESVTAFTHLPRSLPEYFRVLRSGGQLFAVEMTVEQKLPEQDKRKICDFYGVPDLYTTTEWENQLKKSGFSEVYVLEGKDFFFRQKISEFPLSLITKHLNEEALKIWMGHLATVNTYQSVLNYRIYHAMKKNWPTGKLPSS
ncbi:class I SAM-dependent methyltransferase [Sporolactobacillus sp. Y61]|uniref:Class I SAM-dependent methyltransferase n=1 Tax=Sporolactobacillus sp. Y61 TaxID=3160863 RepID=A0AAU8IES9_9BACL